LRFLISTLAILVLTIDCFSQNKRDYNWLFAAQALPAEGFEGYGFNFNNSDTLIDYETIIPIRISGLNASISDKEGNLLFYTNGCDVVNANHEFMPNGRDLNSGDYFEMIGQTCSGGYLGKQDIIILPDPSDNQGYFILHKPVIKVDSIPELFRELRYSYVDMSSNNGFGDVTIDNIQIADSLQFMFRYLTAINHSNGKDWWIIQAIENKEGFFTLLLDENGFSDSFIQYTDMPFNFLASASGTAVFSPNGEQFAYFNKDDNLWLYKFDRSSGLVSNVRRLTLKRNTPNASPLSSVEFSSDSRFLYVSVQDSLWQVDTYQENLETGTELIDVWDGTNDPFSTTFLLMALAPDCRIYMTSGSSTNTYHVINNPNVKGAACDFVQRGIQLPYTSSLGNLPNFPRFRVDEEEKCDPTITSIFGEDIYYRQDLIIYPNPAIDQLNIQLPENQSGHLWIFDMTGSIVFQQKYTASEQQVSVDLHSYPTGTYQVEFIPDDGNVKKVWTARVVVVDE